MNQVEIEGEDGSKLALVGSQSRVFGRGCDGFRTQDRTVSRRHVSFQLLDNSKVSFEVIGRNPFWVCSADDGEGSLTLFRKFDKGQLELGDRFSFSGKAPIWFHFNKPTAGPHSEDESSGVDLDIDQIDLSQIDLVKEFGFLVMGHEFDHYPKGKIRNVKDWQWFLEEPRKDSDEEEEDDEGKERRKMRWKRKKGKDNEDEEWVGESEDDKDLVSKIRKGKRPLYSTRSKDSKKGPNRDTKVGGTSSKRKKTTNVKEDTGEEEDETLGGFIVDDEEDDQEDDDENDGEEEEEFEDEED